MTPPWSSSRPAGSRVSGRSLAWGFPFVGTAGPGASRVMRAGGPVVRRREGGGGGTRRSPSPRSYDAVGRGLGGRPGRALLRAALTPRGGGGVLPTRRARGGTPGRARRPGPRGAADDGRVGRGGHPGGGGGVPGRPGGRGRGRDARRGAGGPGPATGPRTSRALGRRVYRRGWRNGPPGGGRAGLGRPPFATATGNRPPSGAREPRSAGIPDADGPSPAVARFLTRVAVTRPASGGAPPDRFGPVARRGGSGTESNSSHPGVLGSPAEGGPAEGPGYGRVGTTRRALIPWDYPPPRVVRTGKPPVRDIEKPSPDFEVRRFSVNHGISSMNTSHKLTFKLNFPLWDR